MKRILALFLLLLMSAACAESAPLPYAIESGFLIFPAEDGKQPVPIAVKDGFAAKAQELAAENAYLGTPMNLPEALLPYVSDELTGGEELVEIYATEAVIVMHTRSAADGDVLRWAELDGGQYAVYRKIIGTDFWLQTSFSSCFLLFNKNCLFIIYTKKRSRLLGVTALLYRTASILTLAISCQVPREKESGPEWTGPIRAGRKWAGKSKWTLRKQRPSPCYSSHCWCWRQRRRRWPLHGWQRRHKNRYSLLYQQNGTLY